MSRNEFLKAIENIIINIDNERQEGNKCNAKDFNSPGWKHYSDALIACRNIVISESNKVISKFDIEEEGKNGI